MLSLMWCNFSGLDCLSGKTAFKAESRLECERAQTELEIQLFYLFILNLTRSISPINPPAISMHWPKIGKLGHLAGGYFEQTHETKTVWQTPNVWAAVTATAPRQPSASQHNGRSSSAGVEPNKMKMRTEGWGGCGGPPEATRRWMVVMMM